MSRLAMLPALVATLALTWPAACDDPDDRDDDKKKDVGSRCEENTDCESGFCYYDWFDSGGECGPRSCGQDFPPCPRGGPCVELNASLVCGCANETHCDPGFVCSAQGECRLPSGPDERCFGVVYENEEDIDIFAVDCEVGLECANQTDTGSSVRRRCKEPEGLGGPCLVDDVDQDGCAADLRCAGFYAYGSGFVAGEGTCVDGNAVGQLGDPCDLDATEDICQGGLTCARDQSGEGACQP